MYGTRQSCAFRLQSVLCIVLVLNVHWFGGCGAGFGLPTTAGAFQIQLTDSHSVTQALRGSAFQGANMMEVYPQTQGFRLIYPDVERQVAGNYTYVNGEFVITQFTFKNGAESATVTFDDIRQVSTITTSSGQSWSRVRDSALTRPKTSAELPQLDNPYANANRDLIEVARQVDADAGITSDTGSQFPGGDTTNPGGVGVGVKSSGQDVNPSVSVLLALITALWAPLAGLFGPLLAIFSVATVIENTMVLRLDGTWRATNGSSNMLVTISNGKIIKLVDESSQQELPILDSTLDSVSGNRVVWSVLATVMGQATDVEFTFDVQEQSDGTLDGTLTALGSAFARVAVKMTRA